MAHRRRNDPFIGLLIIAVGVIAVLGWLKDNIIDKISPDMWVLIVVTGLFLLAWRIWSGVRLKQMRDEERRKIEAEAELQAQDARRRHHEYVAWGVEKAVSIATHQKWVSPHRLRTQIHVTEKQAMDLLQFGAQAGVLHQEVNGRYYITDLARSFEVKTIEEPKM